MSALDLTTSSSTVSSCPDCSAFLNWDKKEPESGAEKAVVFRSLVATLKFKPALDDSLEAKVVKLLKSAIPKSRASADDFLSRLGLATDESLTDIVQSIVVLISLPSQAIIKAAMELLSCQSPSMVATLSNSFAATLARLPLLPSGRRRWMDGVDWWEFVMMRLDFQNRLPRSLRMMDLTRSSADPSDDDSE
ncbi:hypothetical protein BLNAU_11085 [Blattamonas nauphoetae]|uniref:Uncharacterized protein n=1 Tax=Blattamonas nauphoetae TaxID=2049346 RepID=A0ABQ9XNJ4_9EUKA|nr:hypothetical protein BLNAU_11085 [Blattamonas nauphoetae]